MQREKVKAHELRKKEEDALVSELTKYRVLFFIVCLISTSIERIGRIESKQGLSCSSS